MVRLGSCMLWICKTSRLAGAQLVYLTVLVCVVRYYYDTENPLRTWGCFFFRNCVLAWVFCRKPPPYLWCVGFGQGRRQLGEANLFSSHLCCLGWVGWCTSFWNFGSPFNCMQDPLVRLGSCIYPPRAKKEK